MVFTYLRKHPELVPLFVVVGAGCVGAGYYLMRLALKNPDATWDRKNNPYPWQKIKHDQCLKFYTHTDYSTLENKRPNID
ncbi:cytochrome c oxidase subunit NDUFA4-like [Pocillopora damicornis]|uniref:cytochrome c oxidase subunit NDUFA4-like n=1 Tax=Pocillopora damicornis TaxID=46731 RepID=UPI000F5527BD|nr:cytochrome c oxidase subunit NDUFA4-like [Pocillopora damicornis]